MAKLEEIYPLTRYETVDDLKTWMAKANAYGFVSRTQAKAILQKLTLLLPVEASLTIRTYKQTIYMLANGARFRVTPRAQIDDTPWNPNPRRQLPNPWLD